MAPGAAPFLLPPPAQINNSGFVPAVEKEIFASKPQGKRKL